MEPGDVYNLAFMVEEGDITTREFRRRLNESEEFYTDGRTTDPLVYRGRDTDTTVEFYLTERKIEVYTGDMERFREREMEDVSETPQLPEPTPEDSEEDFSHVITRHLDLDANRSKEVVQYLEDESLEHRSEEKKREYLGEGWSATLYMTEDMVHGLEFSWDVEKAVEPYDEVLEDLEKYGETVAIRIGEGSQSMAAQGSDSFIDLEMRR